MGTFGLAINVSAISKGFAELDARISPIKISKRSFP